MKTLVFDTETTDLISNSLKPVKTQPQIIEFFGLELGETPEDDKSHHWLIHPGKPVPAEVVKITGITDEMLIGKPKFADVAAEIVALIERQDRVVAHNFSYDRAVTNFEVQRVPTLKPIKWPRGICTVEQSEAYMGYRLNLSSLHEYLFGETFTGAHRAEEDVRALTRCYREMIRRDDI